MTDRGIIFSAAMIRALLAGRKTQTRRVLKPSNSIFGSATKEFWSHGALEKAWPDHGLGSGGYLHVPCHVDEDDGQNFIGADCAYCRDFLNGPGWATTVHRLYPQWRIGDRLWVREALKRVDHAWAYAADDEPVSYPGRAEIAGLKRETINQRFMRRSCSRLTLTVTDVRVQRLQDISEEDAVAEGVEARPFPGPWWQGYRRDERDGSLCHQQAIGEHPPAWMIEPHPMAPTKFLDSSARHEFEILWRHLHGPDAWSANPWVAALTFSVAPRNIDALPSPSTIPDASRADAGCASPARSDADG